MIKVEKQEHGQDRGPVYTAYGRYVTRQILFEGLHMQNRNERSAVACSTADAVLAIPGVTRVHVNNYELTVFFAESYTFEEVDLAVREFLRLIGEAA